MKYLEDLLYAQFESTFAIYMESFDFQVVRSSGLPISIDFEVLLTFSETSAFIPTKQEVDIVTELAFLPPTDKTLLAQLEGIGLKHGGEYKVKQAQYTSLNSLEGSNELKIGLFGKERWKSQGLAIALVSLVAIVAALGLIVKRRFSWKHQEKLLQSETTPIIASHDSREETSAKFCAHNGSDWSMSSGYDAYSSGESDSLMSWRLDVRGSSSSATTSSGSNRFSSRIRVREV